MVSRCFLSWPDEASSHFFMPKPASQRFPVRAAVRKKRAESIRPLFMPYARSVVQFLVSVIVVLGTEPLAQPFFHAAAAHAQIMPAADQQADKGRKRQTGANDLHDHARSFAHRKILLFSDIFTVYGDMIHRLQ